MIAIPLKDKFTLKRAPYWGYLLLLAVMNQMAEYVTSAEAFVFLVLALAAGLVTITYGRVKDIGWHGGMAILLVVPLFNIVIGCWPSKTKTTGFSELTLEGEQP